MQWFEQIIARSRDELGATSAEYAITASLIALAVVFSVTAVGQAVADIFFGFVADMGW